MSARSNESRCCRINPIWWRINGLGYPGKVNGPLRAGDSRRVMWVRIVADRSNSFSFVARCDEKPVPGLPNLPRSDRRGPCTSSRARRGCVMARGKFPSASKIIEAARKRGDHVRIRYGADCSIDMEISKPGIATGTVSNGADDLDRELEEWRARHDHA